PARLPEYALRTTLRIRDFNAEDLLFARFDSPQVLE
ncbi:hypothetical protein PSYMO_37736, partial [Pseudomonas amygdali pv. mori str. 301020]